MKQRSLLWFRRDLRLADNPALVAACESGEVIPVYIHAPAEQSPWQPGAAQRVWLHYSLQALDEALRQLGSRLVIRHGASLETLRALLETTDATAVHWNRLYEPKIIERDKTIKQALRNNGIDAYSHDAALLCEPWQIQTQAGDPYKVFTPFWRALSRTPVHGPLATPECLPEVAPRITSVAIEDLNLLPKIAWHTGILASHTPGENGAHAALENFIDDAVARYAQGRDLPAQAGTSGLSPHFHYGEIGPRQVWHRVYEHLADNADEENSANAESFLREIAWREFAHHLLFHFPSTPEHPMDRRFANFPWREDAIALRAWQRGQTGIPMVDAGMRELWHTGWMHNRVRMVTASFLCKNLLMRWQHGAAWFWDTLVDADLANNTLGWQWVAGCGADAAPYFRIFNPALQGERFDQHGEYIRKWVPELAHLPSKHLHRPWAAPGNTLKAAGVRLGQTYPQPLVDLQASRKQALAAFKSIKFSEK